MCMTTKEMNDTMAAYQEWKRVKEEEIGRAHV